MNKKTLAAALQATPLLTASIALATAFTLLSGCESEEKVATLGKLQYKDDVYIKPETQTPYSGKYVAVDKNNIVIEAGTLKDGKRHEKAEYYSKEGQLIITTQYKDGVAQLSSFSDPRDGKIYKAVIIGSQIWMAENLNYNAEGSKCYGEGAKVYDYVTKKDITLSENEIQANCQKYGRLYDWSTAWKACPPGWHLPTDEEWDTLMVAAGGTKKEILDPWEYGFLPSYDWEPTGKKLKSKTGWNDDGNGTDDYGFSALPGGHCDGYCWSLGDWGYWWSSTTSGAGDGGIFRRFMISGSAVVGNRQYGPSPISVRCLGDY